MTKTQFMSVDEIKAVYVEYCKKIGIRFSKKNFEKFLEFLSIDVYDWVNNNLRYFDQH